MPVEDLSAVPCPWGAVPTLVAERHLYHHGYLAVAGLDEVGRGCLAGPVVAAAVILPLDTAIEADLAGVRDSKQLTPKRREQLAHIIQGRACGWAVGHAGVAAIDQHNILRATRLAMQDALRQLDPAPTALLLDAIRLPAVSLPQVPLIKGDQRSFSIAAASILAKVARDALMCEFDDIYPGYGFAQHKGYGTPHHMAALQQLGPCAQHRRSFAPVRALLDLPHQMTLMIPPLPVLNDKND